jgi:hypothetical protein
MMRIHRRLRALAFLFVLTPLCSLQPAHASPASLVDNCVRTQGYWKNHSSHASNPSQNIPWPISEETPICSTTWFDAINTTPRGDPWFILAHQWIAAKLNQASGADTSVLGGDLDEAGNLLADNCNGLSGDDATRAIELAGILDDYNNGLSGPPHCGDGGGGGGGGSIKTFCDGTGSANGGVDCPCGNNVPTGPSGCANSTGSGASLTGTGNPSVSNDTVVLTATGIPSGHVAYFLYAQGSNSGITFGDGVRCIKGPFQRIHKVSHSSGMDVFPAPGSPPISQQLGITSGQLTFFQVVYRDGNGPCLAGANATNAVAILWGP